ncbi:MAG: hypothetical protein VKL59_12750 [Nostocaceae cyanobacterium]|nr:hypothetical protein [Nostocaceae cyanobacterium]
MNFKAIAMAAILGLSAPAIMDVATNSQAVAATRFNYPSGVFKNENQGWQVQLYFRNNAYHYQGKNLKTGSNISLIGATTSGTQQRQIYTWRNSQYRYQIAWRPSDPGVVRLQVFSRSGKVVLNCLLYEEYGD